MKTLMQTSRPKGYNTKVWEYFYNKAIADKAWALNIIKTDLEWSKGASYISIVHLGECLSLSEYELAKRSYDYFAMRAHGYTFIGALDPSAFNKWKELTGKVPSKSKRWEYNHTTSITFKKHINGKFI